MTCSRCPLLTPWAGIQCITSAYQIILILFRPWLGFQRNIMLEYAYFHTGSMVLIEELRVRHTACTSVSCAICEMCKWKQLSSWYCCYNIWIELIGKSFLGVWSVCFCLVWNIIYLFCSVICTALLQNTRGCHINSQTTWTVCLVNCHPVRLRISLGTNRIVKTNHHLPSQVFVPVQKTNSTLWAITQEAVCPQLTLLFRIF